MNQKQPIYGAPNPNAPSELAQFAFLVGNWRCVANILVDQGKWLTFPASWKGRYILSGYAIADEYRMHNLTGDDIVLGLNVRTYDPTNRRWNIRWLNALTGEWTDLSSDELGGVRFLGNSISYAFREPVAAHPFTRATYSLIAPDHFTWHGEQSLDGLSWANFMVVECYRAPDPSS